MSGYTVIDLETTGLFPKKHDRVVEIAMVFVSDAGQVQGSWSTLINPGRDVGPTHIHGITAREVLRAPTFQQLAPLIIRSIVGRTVVAHNARFDLGFLDYEFLNMLLESLDAVELSAPGTRWRDSEIVA